MFLSSNSARFISSPIFAVIFTSISIGIYLMVSTTEEIQSSDDYSFASTKSCNNGGALTDFQTWSGFDLL